MSQEILLCVLLRKQSNKCKKGQWVSATRGMKFIPSPVKIVIITLINQRSYLCMCQHNLQGKSTYY